jgi:hypothetical protein
MPSLPLIPRSKGLTRFIPIETRVAQPGVHGMRRVCVCCGGGGLGYGVARKPHVVIPVTRSSDHPIIRSSDHTINRSRDQPIMPSPHSSQRLKYAIHPKAIPFAWVCSAVLILANGSRLTANGYLPIANCHLRHLPFAICLFTTLPQSQGLIFSLRSGPTRRSISGGKRLPGLVLGSVPGFDFG